MSLRNFAWFIGGTLLGAVGGGFIAFTYAWLRAVGRI